MSLGALSRKLKGFPLLQFYKDLPINLGRQTSSWFKQQLPRPNVALDTTEKHCLAQLNEQGYTIVENYWPADRALALGRQLEQQVAIDDNQTLPCGATIRVRFRRDNVGIRRIYQVEKLLPELAALRFAPLCHKVASAFYRIPFQSQLLIYQYDGLTGITDGDWHIDTFYPEMKALLLLQDIDQDCGPTAYIKGSHRLHRLRNQHQFFGYRRDRRLRFFSEAQLAPWLDHQVLLCGSAGTLILFDGRGFHRATAQHGRPRSFLMNYLIRS